MSQNDWAGKLINCLSTVSINTGQKFPKSIFLGDHRVWLVQRRHEAHAWGDRPTHQPLD